MRYAINFRNEEDSDLPDLTEVMSRQAGKQTIDARSAYHYLVNIDDFPEMLPLAHQLVTNATDAAKRSPSILLSEFSSENNSNATKSFSTLAEYLAKQSETFKLDELKQQKAGKIKGERLAQQLTPTMLVTGCLLQNFSRVATAHTPVAAILNKSFSLQTLAYAASDLQQTHQIGNDIVNLFSTFHESRLSKKSAINNATPDCAFELPLLLLSFSQFPRDFLPELLGLNLAWHCLGINSFVEKTSLENFLGSDLNEQLIDSLNQRDQSMATLALEAIDSFCKEQTESTLPSINNRILCGVEILSSAWSLWVQNTKDSLAVSEPSPRAKMIELIRHKGPSALGYHRDKKFGEHKIDELLDINKFDPAVALDHLAQSHYIVPGNSAESALTNRLVKLGGPMPGIFSGEELETMRSWIDSLSTENSIDNSAENSATENLPSQPERKYPLWEKSAYLSEAREEHANRPCSLRELYYKLVNVEYFPDVLPIAEQFLIDRLQQSRSSLTSGDRPLPSIDYNFDKLEKWVFDKHRQQVDAYQPLVGKPNISKEAFVKATASLAPLLLVDGGWLQGASSLNTLYTPTGLQLYRIFYEEIGEGSADLHHSNIYRDLLEAMGVTFAEVSEIDFAFSEQFDDASFEVPILWLSLSCFTRHYFPELLGINLAVELAGIGAGYLEAHDTLKHFGFPTAFVDYHNSNDNVSAGHAAWSLDAIKTYMSDVAEREGNHNLNSHWHRIWSGMRLTLPASSDFYWNPTSNAENLSQSANAAAPSAIFRTDTKIKA